LLPEDVPWPWLDGNEWASDYVVWCGGEPRRIDLNGWDEYFDPDTGVSKELSINFMMRVYCRC